MPGLRSFFETTKSVIAVTAKTDNTSFVMTNLETGAIVGTVPHMPLALAEDRRLTALRSDDGNALIVWDLDAGNARISLEARASRLRGAAFNDDGSYLACQSQTHVVVYETQKFDQVGTFLCFLQMAFLDRKTLAVPLPQEGSVRFHNIGSNAELARLTMGCWDVRIARESRSVFAFGRKPQVVRLGSTVERRRLLGHDGGVPGVEFTPDGTRLVSIGKDHTIRFWDATTGNQISMQGVLETPGQGLAVTPDGRYFATCEWSGSNVFIRFTTNNQVSLALDLPSGAAAGVYAISFSHDGRYLGVGGPSGLHLWELKSSDDASGTRLQAQKIYSIKGVIDALQFDRSNKWLTYVDGQPGQEGIYLMRLDKLDDKPERISKQRTFIESLGFLPRDGALACMVGGSNRSVEFWNPESKKVIRTIPTVFVDEPVIGSVNCFRISPDGSKLAVTNGTGRGVNVVDIATGRRLFALPDDTGTVWWLTWSPDSTRLVVSRSEGDISIWDLPKAQAVLVEAKLWDIDDPNDSETVPETARLSSSQATPNTSK
jgi:WD40 repeat protein